MRTGYPQLRSVHFVLVPLSGINDRKRMSDPLAITAVLSAGFILGLKHAMDADHVVAVSTLVNGSESTKAALRTGALWGIGHTVTLMLVCLVVVPLNIPISGRSEAFLEALVGVFRIAGSIYLLTP